MIEKILTAGWLLTASVMDIRSRRIPVWLLVLGGLGAGAAVIYSGAAVSAEWPGLLMGCVPGLFTLLTAAVTGKAGTADGFALIFLGLCLKGRMCLAVFMTSLFLIAVFAGIMLTLRRIGRNTELPYLPFLFASWLLASGFLFA